MKGADTGKKGNPARGRALKVEMMGNVAWGKGRVWKVKFNGVPWDKKWRIGRAF